MAIEEGLENPFAPGLIVPLAGGREILCSIKYNRTYLSTPICSVPMFSAMRLKTVFTASLLSLAVTLTAAEPEPIFDGSSLTGWRGNAQLWSVEDAAIVGRTSDENPIQQNTFLVYERPVGDFELRLQYKIDGGNSGVQYRSKIVDESEFVVAGYQADIDATGRFTGILYEEKGRGILAERGEIKRIVGDDKKVLLGSCGDAAELGKVPTGEWNDYLIIARGPLCQHYINGRLMSQIIDDSEAAAEEGVLALQLHKGPAMTVMFRNLQLLRLDD